MSGRPRLPVLGFFSAAIAVTVTTLILFPLGRLAPPVSLGVVYLLGVLLVATVWGLWLGIATGLAAAAAFNFFHLHPAGGFTIEDERHWIALAVLVMAAVATSWLAEVARSRAREAELRRREADLAAVLARVLLGTPDLAAALASAAGHIAGALDLPEAAITLAPPAADARGEAVPLQADGETIGWLLVPAFAAAAARDRAVPALEALLRAALEREALTREVVETSALRRSDDIKTAVLRSVSHDLRSPLTAIRAASEALASPMLEDEDRRELADAVVVESRRLSRLVDQLLDLSRLQTGTAESREDWCSLEEVIRAAVEDVSADGERTRLAVAGDVPLIRADATQLRRALANLVDNALRYGDGHPVSVRAGVSGGRVLVRVVDRGPGIPPAESERVFEPFYRSPAAGGSGSGLGLAIVRGLVEANGGRVRVEASAGAGTSFVIELPLPTATRAHAKEPV